MTPEQQQVAVDMMDLHVARPVDARAELGSYGRMGGAGQRGALDERPQPARYCYVKLVAPDPNVNERYHTYFCTMEGKPIKFDNVLGYRIGLSLPFEVTDRW